jgi:putative transposase
MATARMDVSSFVGKLLEEDDVDVLRDGVRVLAQALMETEVSSQIGAAPYERSSWRTSYRNGYRTRTWDTRVGTIELKIPKVTAGTYVPSLLEPRRRAEKALQAVVVEAYVKGVSMRKGDDLVRALGIDGISKSEVSRICKVLDEDVKAFMSRPVEGEHPYVWLDATFHKIREGGAGLFPSQRSSRSASPRPVTAACWAVTPDQPRTTRSGWRFSAAWSAAACAAFASTRTRGSVRPWRRSWRVRSGNVAAWHFMRNLLSVVPKGAQDTVAAIVRTIFAQADQPTAMTQLREVVQMLRPRFPQAAQRLEAAAEDLLAHLHFPPREHRRRLHSTNPLERLHKEIKRRTNVVGIFPNRASLMRMVATLLQEQDDEWQVADRRYFSAGSMAHVDELGGDTPRELLEAIA